MFLNQEKPEMDDFGRKICLVLKEKNRKYQKFLTDTLARISQNIFVYSFVSEHSKNVFYFEKKTAFFSGGWSTPSPPLPLADASPKNESFFLRAPSF